MDNKAHATKRKPRKGKKNASDENTTPSPCQPQACPKPHPLYKQVSAIKAGDAQNDAALALMSLGAARQLEPQDGRRMDYVFRKVMNIPSDNEGAE